jgi:hypothetical protein
MLGGVQLKQRVFVTPIFNGSSLAHPELPFGNGGYVKRAFLDTPPSIKPLRGATARVERVDVWRAWSVSLALTPPLSQREREFKR